MTRRKWIQLLGVALLSMILITSYSLLWGSKDVTKEIDPPPEGYTASSEVDLVMDSTPEKTQTATIYVQDAHGYVVPLLIDTPETIALARQTLEYMVQGGPANELLPKGFSALLPEGTEVLGINVIPDQKLAIVDFSKEFTQYEAGQERKLLEGLTWSLTQYSTIDQVQLRVDGENVKTMPQKGTPIDRPLSRVMGINVEKPEGLLWSQAQPVTLYFKNQTNENQSYFVPVTRMIQKTDDISMAAVQQLIKGPAKNTPLLSVIDSAAQILQISESQDMLTINLDGASFTEDAEPVSAETLQSIILALTDNTPFSQVQILLNGEMTIQSTDDSDYSVAVTRPAHLNDLDI